MMCVYIGFLIRSCSELHAVCMFNITKWGIMSMNNLHSVSCNGVWRVGNCLWENEKWCMGNEKLCMGKMRNGVWVMRNGVWIMRNGVWVMRNGIWVMRNGVWCIHCKINND